MENSIKMAAAFLLTISLITALLLFCNSVTTQTSKSIQALGSIVSSTTTNSDTIETTTPTLSSETKGKQQVTDKSSGLRSFTRALWFIIPALLIGLLLGRLIFPYARSSIESRISAPWEGGQETAIGQSNNHPIRPHRPASVADALENMLAKSNTLDSSKTTTIHTSANAYPIQDQSDSGIRVIRKDFEEFTPDKNEKGIDPEVKRVIR
ncbi:hypothetical protein EHV15_35030 [Paenibacillus oralis]|uniref:Uncharacterized protein n=1 Tax=Paenibacillus oralis TaxID=2490856 RepID=A0A3P3T9R6_9BACL|nr:hypothetical protein [Paenibacillus oralis]RRJ54805.1 hypothetical protein EHV15_35030 [Paenibacillus oralis]